MSVVSVVSVASKSLDHLSTITSNFLRQIYESKKLHVILRSDALQERDVQRTLIGAGIPPTDLQVIKVPTSMTLGQCYNQVGLRLGDFLAVMDEDHFYGPTYITEKLQCIEEKKAYMVGQNHFFCYDPFRQSFSLRRDKTLDGWCDWVRGPTFFMRKHLLSILAFSDQDKGYDSQFLRDAKKNNIRMYAHFSNAFVYMTDTLGMNLTPLVKEEITRILPFLEEVETHLNS